MTDTQEDRGLTTVLLERFANTRLPRVLDIKQKVDSGEKLDTFDIDYLERIFKDSAEVQRMLELHPHPEFEDLVARVAHLYHEITAKALENEKST